ncbi:MULTISPECIES: cysteine-rich CWC family protein [Parabacteroides]|uniref:cysteine-rich CWC family protein n=1 Tax=Parabacteroides provencensis TaxID=1944636 RepID=UPI000C15EBF0|nr:cysteine-rich CWC family protein [Parabacteroides provencensis]
MEKTCPRCGASFVCQSDNIAYCQCSTVKLDVSQREYVKRLYYPKCLCKSCLEEIKLNFSKKHDDKSL